MSGEHALAHVKNPSVFANVAPTAARRFALHFSIGQGMHTDLVYAQELLSHQIPPGDLEEVARGGRATMGGIRLRCRAHNQFTAEQTFGRELMENKREESRRAAERAREIGAERAEARAHADAQARADELAHAEVAA